MAELNKSFRCRTLVGTLSYETCLKRQAALMERQPKFIECSDCATGKVNKLRFPGYEPEKQDCRNHVIVKTGKEKRRLRKEVSRYGA